MESLQKQLFQETKEEVPVPPWVKTPVLEPKQPDAPALPMTPLQVRASEKADPPMSRDRVQHLKNEVGAALQGTKAARKAKAKSRTNKTKQNKDKEAEEEDGNPLESEEALSEDEQGSQEDGEEKAKEKACIPCICFVLEQRIV